MFTISNETPEDHCAIDSLLDAGFGAERNALTVYRLRLAPPRPDLGFVIRDENRLVASLRFWPVLVGPSMPALLLGPLVVAPDRQGAGLGKRLVRHALDQVSRDGWRLCLVVGGPNYYAPFGFEPAAPWGFALPGPVALERFQVRALGETTLTDLLPSGGSMVHPWRSVRGGGLIDHRGRWRQEPSPLVA
jgi:predicted N-acetyltransferase YhbS